MWWVKTSGELRYIEVIRVDHDLGQNGRAASATLVAVTRSRVELYAISVTCSSDIKTNCGKTVGGKPRRHMEGFKNDMNGRTLLYSISDVSVDTWLNCSTSASSCGDLWFPVLKPKNVF